MAVALMSARELVLDLVIEGHPVPKARARITRYGNYTPRRSQDEAMAIEWLMKQQFPHPSRGDLIVDVDFFRGNRRPCDLDNLVKQIFDCANGIVWHDDNQVVCLYAQKLHDKERPRTELRVWKRATE